MQLQVPLPPLAAEGEHVCASARLTHYGANGLSKTSANPRYENE